MRLGEERRATPTVAPMQESHFGVRALLETRDEAVAVRVLEREPEPDQDECGAEEREWARRAKHRVRYDLTK